MGAVFEVNLDLFCFRMINPLLFKGCRIETSMWNADYAAQELV